MSNKLVVIISTSDLGKARTGMMYSVNALTQGWMEDVKLFFFGPAQQLLLTDPELQKYLEVYRASEETVVACKHIADRDGIEQSTADLGVNVEYVGVLISDLIKQGYTPMVW